MHLLQLWLNLPSEATQGHCMQRVHQTARQKLGQCRIIKRSHCCSATSVCYQNIVVFVDTNPHINQLANQDTLHLTSQRQPRNKIKDH